MINHNAERGPWLLPGITERLADLHAERGAAELSMTQIAAILAAEFGREITSNAVIGRCRRIGMPKRSPLKWSRPPPPSKRNRVDAPIPPLAAIVKPACESLTLVQLRDDVCHWPLGEVEARPPYQYCGKPSLFGQPYCPVHHKRSHNQQGSQS